MKIERIEIKGYRSLKETSVEIRNLNVLIGPNGAGKTSFLEVFQLLKDAVDGKLSENLSDKGGIHSVLFMGGRGILSIKIVPEPEMLHEESTKYLYGFELMGRGTGYSVVSENLNSLHTSNREGVSTPRSFLQTRNGKTTFLDPETGKEAEVNTNVLQIMENETALSQLPKSLIGVKRFVSIFENIEFYGTLDVSKRAPIMLPQVLTPSVRPGHNGNNLLSALYNMRTDHHKEYENLMDSLKVAFPGFRKLEFTLVAAGSAALSWYQDPFDTPLYANQLSEGTLRFLWLATILLSPSLPSIILIDEPEISLHPDSLKLLAALLRKTSARAQIIVATHSSALVDFLKPDNVLVVDRNPENGCSFFRWGDTFNLDAWLEEYTLGDLWRMRELV